MRHAAIKIPIPMFISCFLVSSPTVPFLLPTVLLLDVDSTMKLASLDDYDDLKGFLRVTDDIMLFFLLTPVIQAARVLI